MDLDRDGGQQGLEREAHWRVDGAGNRPLHGTHPYSLHHSLLTACSHLICCVQLDRVREGQFYVICPDNETRQELDQLRIMWAAGDVAEGRPALSRWHKDYKSLFEEYVHDGLEGLDL